MTTKDTISDRDSPKPLIRIDAAHRMVTAGKAESVAVHATASVVQSAGESSEQVQLQADQLSQHLQDRRRDVDHREAQLNARIAQLESELRLSRLWLREQNQEFTQREVEVRQQLSENECRVAAVAAAELALEDSRRQLVADSQAREEQLARRELQLKESQQRLADEAQRLQTARRDLESERQRLEREQEIQQTHQSRIDLEQLERLHQQQVNEWKRERAELQKHALQRQQELDSEHESLTLQSRRWLEEQEQQRQVLERDRQQLDQRQATLERVRAEVLRIHREALEMRLVAEQLWGQLTSRCSSVELTAAVSKLRNQLADEFRFASQDLESQRTTLHELIQRLEQKQQELTSQRNELLEWFRRRQADLAQKAAELSEQNQRLIAERRQFHDERFEHQANRPHTAHRSED